MKRIADWLAPIIKKYAIAWGVVTLLFYAAAIPLTVWVFPATTLILSIFVLFGGFTASLSALGALLAAADTAEKDPIATALTQGADSIVLTDQDGDGQRTELATMIATSLNETIRLQRLPMVTGYKIADEVLDWIKRQEREI